MPCRIHGRRQQTAKLLLEGASHRESSFCTLTYEDSECPCTVEKVPTLRKADAVDLLRRLRGITGWSKQDLRHYTVGEYGSRTGRPHLHMLWFGVNWYDAWSALENVWQKGYVQAQPMNETRAQYICGYTTKKLTKADDERLVEGQEPEFKLQVHQPGLGMSYLARILEWYFSRHGSAALAEAGDVCATFRYRGKLYPLTDYQKRYLRKRLGLPVRVQDLRQARPDCHPIELPPTLSDLEDRRIKYVQAEKRKAIFCQQTDRI